MLCMQQTFDHTGFNCQRLNDILNLVSLGTMRQCMKGHQKYVLVYKNSGEVLSKLKSRVFSATCLSTYDFSTLYTT